MTDNKAPMIAVTALAIALLHGTARAQAIPATGPGTATDAITADIVVTAQKKANGALAQKTPIAISAFGQGQLEAMQLHDVTALTTKIPNVQLTDVGTTKGVANFTIRGLGVNSSIPSIDPAVGVFVDGVYLGMNSGVVFDTFDLASVEVLRGPQGVLFGRNVTGGAVLLNTTDPADRLQQNVSLKAESGFVKTGGNYTGSGVVTGPLAQGVLDAKLGVYYNKDDGWFHNLYDNRNFGKSQTFLIRSALKWMPSANITDTLKYEHGNSHGDGPPAQSHTNGYGVAPAYENFGRDTFDFALSNPGYYHSNWDQVTNATEIGVGSGKITNILGWRRYAQASESNIGAQPVDVFDAFFGTEQQQISDELRYAGRIGKSFDFTTGLFYFAQKIDYDEVRNLVADPVFHIPGGVQLYGGGKQRQYTLGAFASGTYRITDALSIDVGARYSYDKKHDWVENEITNLVKAGRAVQGGPCSIIAGTCSFTASPLDVNNGVFSKPTFSPKLGFAYELAAHARIYGDWARAFRSGGFNFRSTTVNPALGPGPFDDEKVDSFELGFKSEPYRRARFNLSAFYSKIGNMQRELNFPDPVSGVVQAIENTANARIYGFETDFALPLGSGVVVDGSASYTNGKYTKLFFDLANPGNAGPLPASDYALKIPRLSPFTANIGLTADERLPVLGMTTLRVSYAHQDKAYYSDDNAGYLNAVNRFDASVSVKVLDGRGNVTIYGQNMTNSVQFGGDTQLPAKILGAPAGGTFSPLEKGRVFGIELRFAG